MTGRDLTFLGVGSLGRRLVWFFGGFIASSGDALAGIVDPRFWVVLWWSAAVVRSAASVLVVVVRFCFGGPGLVGSGLGHLRCLLFFFFS